MTSLRLRMLEDMQIRNLAVNTQESYVQQVSLFARYFNQSPERLGPEQIRAYQVYLTKEKKLATGSILIAVSALRFLYRVTLKKDWTFEDIIPAPKKPQTLPVVLSPEEVLQFLASVASRAPCHLDHMLRSRLAHLRIDRSYTPCHRQQAHGLAGRARQGNEGSLRHALPKAVGDPARVVASGKARALAFSRRYAGPAHQPGRG
jgi:integrase